MKAGSAFLFADTNPPLKTHRVPSDLFRAACGHGGWRSWGFEVLLHISFHCPCSKHFVRLPMQEQLKYICLFLSKEITRRFTMKTFSYELILELSIETVSVKLLLYTKCYTRHSSILQELPFQQRADRWVKSSKQNKINTYEGTDILLGLTQNTGLIC